MSYLGYALIVAGILVILFTFYLGYELYTRISYSSLAPYKAPGTNATTLNGTISSLSGSITSITSSIWTMGYLIIQILLLFLFANIGYKIADLGIKTNSSERSRSNVSGADKKSK